MGLSDTEFTQVSAENPESLAQQVQTLTDQGYLVISIHQVMTSGTTTGWTAFLMRLAEQGMSAAHDSLFQTNFEDEEVNYPWM